MILKVDAEGCFYFTAGLAPEHDFDPDEPIEPDAPEDEGAVRQPIRDVMPEPSGIGQTDLAFAAAS